MNIVFFGTPDFVVPIVTSLGNNFHLKGIVTTPDTTDGRKKILTPSPVKKAYLNRYPKGTVFIPERWDKELREKLASQKPDLFVVAAYGKIIPQDILDIPVHGSINIHPSLLPKYRGPSPIQSAILEGETTTGVSIIVMDKEVDHGPIIFQWKEEILPQDTFQSLHHKLFINTAERLPAIITEYVSGKIIPAAQNHDVATFCKKITREDGYIDLENPPQIQHLRTMIRAFYPWPSVWTKLPKDFGGQARQNAIVKLFPGKRVQLEGKGVVELKDFINGYPALKQLLLPLWE